MALEGVVYKSTGNLYTVKDDKGSIHTCRIRGKLRTQGIRHTNPVAVGDYVTFEAGDENHPGYILSIKERKNYIIRKSNNLSKDTHILASNIDLAVLVVSIGFPDTSTGFIDRFLVTAEAYHIPVLICFNKADLYKASPLKEYLDEFRMIYHNCPYISVLTSVKTKEGIDEFIQHLKGKVCLFSGHSGAGKSSLINLLAPELLLKTQAVSEATAKGQHTTTFAEMHDLAEGIKIIDTPGIRELSVVGIPKNEISHYFKEMQGYIGQCKFNDCMHVNEPDCAIQKALEQNEISASRFASYLSMLQNESVFD